MRYYQFDADFTVLHCVHFDSGRAVVFVHMKFDHFILAHSLNQRSKFKRDGQSESRTHKATLIFIHLDNRIDSDWINEQ